MAQHQITNGPSKLDLVLSLIEGDNRYRKPVIFDFNMDDMPDWLDKPEVTVFMNGLEREDNSGENWNFRGYQHHPWIEVKGFYSSKTRRGWIEKVEE